MMAEAAGRVVAVYNCDFLWEKSAHDLPAMANLLLVLGSFAQPGSGLLLLHDYANSVGLLDMGMDSRFLPGRVTKANRTGVARLEKLWQADLGKIFRPANLLQQMEKRRVKALLVFGEDPFLSPELKKAAEGVEFLLVMDTFLTGTTRAADIVLPATIPLENSGSLTSCERRIQHFRPAWPVASGMENWQVVQLLAQAIGLSWNYTSAAQVFAEIRQANPHYNEAEKDAIWGKELFAGRFPTSSGRARFAFFPVDLAANNTAKVRFLSSEQYFQLHIRKKLWE
jgi:formate dehydrogenase major subunit